MHTMNQRMKTATDSDDEENKTQDENDEEDKRKRIDDKQPRRKEKKTKNDHSNTFALSFRDIEDSIRSFNGSDGYLIENWISDFEETATLMSWNDLKMLIFAKRCLKGVAKAYVQSERGLTSWKILKTKLRSEFSERVTSAQIHRKLATRIKKKDESVQEYLIAMREIANRGSVEDEALIQYVIDGIQEDDYRKVVLYGARTLTEFKHKLKVFNTMKEKSESAKSIDGSKGEKRKAIQRKVESSSSSRCYNCGDKGHMSTDCKHKQEGRKCFNCNQFGHLASQCAMKKNADHKKNSETHKGVANLLSNEFGSKKQKFIKILDTKCLALIDTGCDVNLLREDVYRKLKAPNLLSTEMILNGFGPSVKVKPIGYFNVEMQIDEDVVNTRVYVVNKDVMKHEVIVGNETLNEGELIINRDEIRFRKYRPEVEVLHILIDENTNQTDLHSNLNKEVQDLVKNYKPQKTKDIDVQMKICITEEKPTHVNPRRLPHDDEEFVQSQINEWLENDVIESCYSDFASPVVIVKKKDGGKRLCIDYRSVNKIIMKDRYPLPVIDDLIDQLQGAKLFSTIDLKNGFLHVQVDPNSRKYTSFVVEDGLLQRIEQAQNKDDWIKTMKKVVQQEPFDDYFLRGKMLYKFEDGRDLFVLPKSMQESNRRNNRKKRKKNSLKNNQKKLLKRKKLTLSQTIRKLKLKKVKNLNLKMMMLRRHGMLLLAMKILKKPRLQTLLKRKAKNMLIKKLIQEALMDEFDENRSSMRQEAKLQIKKVQQENKKAYDSKRKPATKYRTNQLVAIKKTQQGPGSKLRPKFLGPYRITKIKPNDTYDVTREGSHGGPYRTTTCAEFLKPWIPFEETSDSSSGTDELEDGRVVEAKIPKIDEPIPNSPEPPTVEQRAKNTQYR